MSSPCPDFELAPLTALSPDIIPSTGEDAVGSYALALTLAYNDFKDLQWVRHQLSKCRPAQAVTGEFGQWIGMVQFLGRRLIALVSEVLVALRAASDEEVVADSEWRAAQNAIPAQSKEYWELLVEAATSDADPEADALRRALCYIRNNAADHYYQPRALRNAYRAHFHATPERTPYSESAYASLGSTLESTRFSFADAAAAKLLDAQFPVTPGTTDGVSFDLFDSLQLVLNQGLKAFLQRFWLQRDSSVGRSERVLC